MVKRIPMPSGITAAFGQQTAATQAKMSGRKGGLASAGKRSKRRASASKKRGTSSPSKRRASAKRANGCKLRKGSAAAKAWGAKMKRLRNRKR